MLFFFGFLKARTQRKSGPDEIKKINQELKSKIGSRPKSLPTVFTFGLYIISFE